jgi:hypothetical protein
LTQKVYNDFYFNEIESIGLKVEYWDVSSLFFKTIPGVEDSSFLTKTIKFNTYKEIEEQLKSERSLDKCLFISIMSFDQLIIKLYKLLTKYNCNLGVFGRNVLPFGANTNMSILDYLKKINIKRISNFIKFKLLQKYLKSGKIKKYDYVFLAGNYGWRGIGRINQTDINNSIKININSDDYDACTMLSNKIESMNKYILFLDEYLPLHPDTILLGIKTIKPNDYYPELNKYFDFVEKKYGLPVIIAAHPKALKYHDKNYFNGRQVLFNQTAALTKDALFVIAHDSTSVNYPIYFNKKIHFITSNNIMNDIAEVHWNTLNFAKYLGCNYQYFDNYSDVFNIVEELPISNYEQFKLDFHTSPETENKKTVDIFLNFLLS